MKRYLLLLLGIMIAAIAMAADVITKKNGTTIQCKVVKVGRTEVEYRPVTNLNGPIYAIDLTEISNIKYENGAVDKFGEQSVIATNSGQRTMTDAELMRMYKTNSNSNGSRLKKTGFIVGGIGAAIFVASIFYNVDLNKQKKEDKYPNDDIPYYTFSIGSACLLTGATCYFIGCHKQKMVQRYACLPIFEQNFVLGTNSLLTADVNMINDNISHDKSLGLGLRFTF